MFAGVNLFKAVVRAGSETTMAKNEVCGPTLTPTQVDVNSLNGTVDVECDKPMKARYVGVQMSRSSAWRQFCPVEVEEVPMADCEPKEGSW